ncbi:hypothetical protein [Fluviicola taffensis]|uniref:Uncharacterized protein n=1 Tax=Fluviicola taffensis (strain DSM 16823 / NCIMB 13979 / RW262) TaxID=755732 RepID=F2ICP4_FLUTR|nr:hypothetical protein [Fluviicola taffensis]AEA42271.1 hypothetical protein Fluta_0262 [Fluviicola taffensis DSM 16823]
MSKFNKMISKIESSEISKKQIKSMLGSIRGGEDTGSGAVSSRYTSNSNACDGTALCFTCLPPVKK